MVVVIDRTMGQQIALNILPRAAALISICCALCIIVTVVRRKFYHRRMYHRIMLGCAINIVIFALTLLWGTAALPADMPTLGAMGNTETCTVSGFMFHYALFVTPSYYFALSILSYVAFCNKFDFTKSLWMEKWIHIGVYLFPLASASYLLSIQAFNPVVNACALASLPLGCGSFGSNDNIDIEDDLNTTTFHNELLFVPCERGPQNISQLRLVFYGIPTLIVVLVPIMIMVQLYCKIRSMEGDDSPIAWSVSKQSGIYILLLVSIYSFQIVYMIFTFGLGKYFFGLNLLANTNEALIGMWIYIAYRYFRTEEPPEEEEYCDDDDDIATNMKKKRRGTQHTFRRRFSATSNVGEQGSSGCLSSPEFSIFDGNDIEEDSPWAAFLTEGEDVEYNSGRIWQQ